MNENIILKSKRFYKMKVLGLQSKEKLYGMSLKKVMTIMMQIEFMKISKQEN